MHRTYSLLLAEFITLSQSHNLFPMPPKRKDGSAASTASGPKTKRSKPSFRTPTTAGPDTAEQSEVNSTKNRVVTLRPSASGRRGYRTQALAMTSNSNPASPAGELSHIPDKCDSISHPTEESDIHPTEESDIHPKSGTKSRPKQKNTTTVRPQLIIAGIVLLTRTYNIDKT
jgi:hypothetical protein